MFQDVHDLGPAGVDPLPEALVDLPEFVTSAGLSARVCDLLLDLEHQGFMQVVMVQEARDYMARIIKK